MNFRYILQILIISPSLLSMAKVPGKQDFFHETRQMDFNSKFFIKYM